MFGIFGDFVVDFVVAIVVIVVVSVAIIVDGDDVVVLLLITTYTFFSGIDGIVTLTSLKRFKWKSNCASARGAKRNISTIDFGIDF